MNHRRPAPHPVDHSESELHAVLADVALKPAF
jgi:hypothetical protein